MDPGTQPLAGTSNPSDVQPPPDLSGKAVGDFVLLRRLGQGGMGQVYLAEQRSLKRKVALKILRADLAQNPTSLQRFKAEGEAVARATHANIVQVYAIGEADGLHYMALEYVEGRNLREYLGRRGPPDLGLILSIMRQVAAALQRAGELGLIHRDVKPDNILLTRKGEVKVADFGLSRCLAPDQPPLHLTQSGVTMGTPLYMSPEQVEGKPLDHRTDIYSFGVTCYHMVAGQPPFQGSNTFEVALKHVREEAVPLQTIRPDLPPELAAIIQKMMAKAPAERYQTCRDLLRDLTRLREGLAGLTTGTLSVLTPSSGTGPAPRTAVLPAPRSGRWRWFVAVAASVLVATLGGAALGVWYRGSAVPPENRTQSSVSPAEESFSSDLERERFFLDALKRFADPGSDRDSQEMGLRHRLALGLLYLKQWRLDDADRFFTELINNPPKVPAYTLLGRVGHAIVLGLTNQVKESNQLFRDLLVEKRPGYEALTRNHILSLHPELRLWIARALEYNTLNAAAQSIPFPEKELGYLRDPPRQQAPGRPGKPLKKVGT